MSEYQKDFASPLATPIPAQYPSAKSAAKSMVDEIVSYINRCAKKGESPRPIASDGMNSFFLHQLDTLDAQTVLAVGEDENGAHIEVICHYTALRVVLKFDDAKSGDEDILEPVSS